MCFAIPYKVRNVKNGIAYLEDGKQVRLDPDVSVKKGEYLQISGDISVGRLSAREGQRIRKIIKSLHTYE